MALDFRNHPIAEPDLRSGTVVAFIESRDRYFCKFKIVNGRCRWAEVVNPLEGLRRIEPGSVIALTETLVAQYQSGDFQSWAVLKVTDGFLRSEDWYRVSFILDVDISYELDGLAQLRSADNQAAKGEGS